LKDNIKKLENVIDTAKKIQGVSFEWDETHEKISKHEYIHFKSAFSGTAIGFIAQEIEKVVPDVVFTSDDGFKSVEYGQLVSIGVGAVQEQQTRIESIYKRINKLKEVIGG
jgi:putative lipoic acid-binding regulatory protein